jgi:Na+/H+ antiporter NhaA
VAAEDTAAVNEPTAQGAAQSGAQSDRTAWARNLAAPVRDFLATETGSAAMLVIAAVIALIWANSPLRHSYESLWTTELSIRLGGGEVANNLRGWVNDGLMTLFFLVVGLEAKRELDLGDLRDRSRALLPIVAAIGGILVPIAIYELFNAGGAGARGWGAAMSTDTALALGALALITPRSATRLRVFLLSFAIVDDLVALVVIATVYTKHVSMPALIVAIALFGVLLALRYLPIWRRQTSVAVAVALWVALFKSGIDPVISGLAIGLVTSAYPPSREDLERATSLARSFREQPTPDLAREAQQGVLAAISPNERLQYSLHPWSSYVVVPLFALANAGVYLGGGRLGRALGSPIMLGIFLGYVLGKPAGILAASRIGTLPRLGLRRTISWPVLATGGAVAGIGFTVSLLVSSLAFRGDDLVDAKVGAISAVIVAPLIGWGATRIVRRLPEQVRARQIAGTVEDLLDLAEEVDPKRDHIRGPEDALVTLVEYGDFECPYCGRAESTIRELLSNLSADVRYVWRHLPLNDVHEHAQLAAEASEAASAQGRFWDYYDALFEDQSALMGKDLVARAERLGLDVDRFTEDLREHRFAGRIADDVASADESGVSGTPTFFINGRRHQGPYDIASLTAAVEAAKTRAGLLAQVA